MLIDSHAHLDDERFAADLEEILDRARRAGVGHIVTIGTGLDSSEAAISLASARKGWISATVGIHPHDADDVTEADLVRLEELAREPSVVGVGETGLDYHHDNASREGQRTLFTQHIKLALKADRPLVIHCREAFSDCLAILNEYRASPQLQGDVAQPPRLWDGRTDAPTGEGACATHGTSASLPPVTEGLQYKGAALRGVAHCFSGTASDAEAFLRLGFHISFAGPLTFPSAGKLREAAKTVPLEHVLIETDCPYLAPQPKRGKRNEPAYVTHIAATLAEIHQMELSEAGVITARNASSLFQLEGDREP